MQELAGTRVREAVVADAAGIAAIGRRAVPDTYRTLCAPAVIRSIVEQAYAPAALRECIERCSEAGDAHFLVAEEAGVVVAFLHYDCDGSQPELHRIYIDPDRKRSGIGSRLLEELHRRLEPQASYVLMVVADNLPAVAFYSRHGFQEEAQVDGVDYMRERMGVEFPEGAAPVPALVLRFTMADPTHDPVTTSKGAFRDPVHG